MNIIQTKPLLETDYLNIYETQYQDTKGKDKNWLWAGRPNNRKAVMIVAEVPGPWKWNNGYSQDNRLAVIKEFRIPMADFEWGFPAGLIDGDEPVETTVIRELREETGLEVAEIKLISPFVYNTAGLTNESIAIAYVTAKGTISKENQEASEDIETFLMNREEVTNLLADKEKQFAAKGWIILNQFANFGRVI